MTKTSIEFPLTGKVCRIDYGDMAFEYDFRTPGKLTYTGTDGEVKGLTETVDINVVPIRDNIFAVTFQDSSGATIVSVEDLTENVVNTFMTMAGQTTHHFQAKLSHA